MAGYPTGGGSPIKRAESPVHTENAPIVAADARRRRALRRQDADRRADVFDERAEQAFSRAGQRARARAASPAAPPRARRRRRRPSSATSPSAPIPAARCARRRAIAGFGASARRMGASTTRARHAARALLRHGRLFRRRPGDLRAASRRCSSARTSGPFRLSRLVARRRRFCAAHVRSRGGGAAPGGGEGRGGARRRRARSPSRRRGSTTGTGPSAACRRWRRGRRTAPGSSTATRT